MASTAQYKCQRCHGLFTARTADRDRGWARFCSKSCKAIKQEQRTGQYAAYKNRYKNCKSNGEGFVYVGGFGEWDEHKD
jgi:hypothetical protein